MMKTSVVRKVKIETKISPYFVKVRATTFQTKPGMKTPNGNFSAHVQ